VPNLYPAFERQEVVVHSPRHVRTFAELTDEELAAVAEAWQARRDSARVDGFPYVHALINEGRAAGSSLPHSHSQLVWLREAPPAVTAERTDAVPELLADRGLRVAELGDMVAVTHRAGRRRRAGVEGLRRDRTALRRSASRRAAGRLRTLEGNVPWNAWLHDGANGHLELVPRLAIQAGIELGAGIAVNTVAPEDAATALRSA
jgi:UDPglucose--hexose-1-phosphate uridylyltransferase